MGGDDLGLPLDQGDSVHPSPHPGDLTPFDLDWKSDLDWFVGEGVVWKSMDPKQSDWY